MKNEVFALRAGAIEEFKIRFEGKVLKPSWLTRGPAQAALDLLEKGYGSVDNEGHIQWKSVIRPPETP